MCGLIGPAVSLNKSTSSVGEMVSLFFGGTHSILVINTT